MLYFVLKVTKENEPQTEIGEATDYSKHFFCEGTVGISLEHVLLAVTFRYMTSRVYRERYPCTYHGELLNETYAVRLDTQPVGALLLKKKNTCFSKEKAWGHPVSSQFRASFGLHGVCVLIVAEAKPYSNAFAFFAKIYREFWLNAEIYTPPDPMTVSQEHWEKANKSKIDHILFQFLAWLSRVSASILFNVKFKMRIGFQWRLTVLFWLFLPDYSDTEIWLRTIWISWRPRSIN